MGHEPFSVDVGSKLFFSAVILLIFTVPVLILLPLGAAFMPAPPPVEGAPPPVIGALMPGIFMLIGVLVLGVLGGLCLGHAYRHYPQYFEKNG